jgi:ADP-ribosylglycohydrolase
MRAGCSPGGDADTVGAIIGSIAEAFCGEIPAGIVEELQRRIPGQLWTVIERFSMRCASETD